MFFVSLCLGKWVSLASLSELDAATGGPVGPAVIAWLGPGGFAAGTEPGDESFFAFQTWGYANAR